MLTELLDRRVLEIGFSAVYCARREIDAAYVRAVILAVDVFIGPDFIAGAFRQGRYGSDYLWGNRPPKRGGRRAHR